MAASYRQEYIRGSARCLLFVVFIAALVAAFYYGIHTSISPLFGGQPALDGCFDNAGNAHSLFASSSDPVNQDSPQCQAVLSLGQEFGFQVPSCSQNTSVTNPTDSTSVFEALFCDKNTVILLRVVNPPKSLATLPTSFASFANVAHLGFHNAFYGSQILSPLLNALTVPKYFQILNMTGAVSNAQNPLKVLTGPIPPFPATLTDKRSYFSELLLANNNLSGAFPTNLADLLPSISVANNTLLTGALPNSVFQQQTGNVSEWTQTMQCDFSNTSLCVPSSGWNYQPACVRSQAFALPTCGKSNQFLPIDPMDPSSYTSNGQNGDDNGSTGSKFLYVVAVSAGIIILGLALFVWFRRSRTWQSAVYNTTGYSTEDYELQGGMRTPVTPPAATVEDLPEYTPALPGYDTPEERTSPFLTSVRADSK